MEYLKVEWMHQWDDEPIVIYSEIDDCRRETRKIEVFRNGRVGYATRKVTQGGALLWKRHFPPCIILRLINNSNPIKLLTSHLSRFGRKV